MTLPFTPHVIVALFVVCACGRAVQCSAVLPQAPLNCKLRITIPCMIRY